MKWLLCHNFRLTAAYRPAQVNNSLIWDQVLIPDVLVKRPSMHYWSSMQETIDFHLLYNLIHGLFSGHRLFERIRGIYGHCPVTEPLIPCLAENRRFLGRWLIKIHGGLSFQVTALAGYTTSPSWYQPACVGTEVFTHVMINKT